MANTWVYGALERVPIEEQGGFRVPFTVIISKSEVSAVYLCAQHDTSPHASPFHSIRKVPGNALTVTSHLGIRSQLVEFMDEWKPSKINRVATTFVETVTPAGRSVSTVVSLIVQYFTPQQTHNVLLRGEADHFPLNLLNDPKATASTTTAAATTSNRNGILQPFLSDPGTASAPSIGVSFSWKAARPATIVFPDADSNEGGLVRWSIVARSSHHAVDDHSVPPYLRGVTVDGGKSHSSLIPLSAEQEARIRRAAELLISTLSRESPLVKVRLIFRFVGGHLYFLHAPLLQHRGEVMDTTVRFVVPRQFLPQSGNLRRGRGCSTVGEEDLLETPRIQVAITLPHDRARSKRVLAETRRRLEAAEVSEAPSSYPALERKKQRLADEKKRLQQRVLASPCPDAPREHPEPDPRRRLVIKRRSDVTMARALLEALEGKRTAVPVEKIARRLGLTAKQAAYLRQLRDDFEGATVCNVTESRARPLLPVDSQKTATGKVSNSPKKTRPADKTPPNQTRGKGNNTVVVAADPPNPTSRRRHRSGG